MGMKTTTLAAILGFGLLLLTGCGQMGASGLSSAANLQPQHAEAALNFYFDITTASDQKTAMIRFKIQNTSASPVTITFPTSPVSFTYAISDASETILETFQDGIAQSLETYTLAAGEIFSRNSFTYIKSDPALVLSAKNAVRYYVGDIAYKKVITTTF